jgi:thiol-disulfide isomerase/thioredoxin
MRATPCDRTDPRGGTSGGTFRSIPAVGFALAIVIAALAACASASGTGTPTATAVGAADRPGVTLFAAATRQLAPGLHGSSLSGTPAALDASAEHTVVVVNVWASWCEPCREESPMLAAMSQRLRTSGVQFFGIDERDTNSKARAFVNSTHMTYQQLADPDGALLLKLRFLPQMGIPSTLIIDRHGRMAARVIGPATAAALQQIVNDLVKEP